MKDQKIILKRLYNHEVKRLPGGFFKGLSKHEIGELVRYVTEDLHGMDIAKIQRLRKSELKNMGFQQILSKKGATTCSLLRLAYPSLRETHMFYKHVGYFSKYINLFETIRWELSDLTTDNIRRIDIMDYVSSSKISSHFKTIDSLLTTYKRWLISRKSNEFDTAEKLTEYKNALMNEDSVILANFWESLTDEQLGTIIIYVVEEYFGKKYGLELYGNLYKLDFKKTKLGLLDKPFYTRMGTHVKNRTDLIDLSYGILDL